MAAGNAKNNVGIKVPWGAAAKRAVVEAGGVARGWFASGRNARERDGSRDRVFPYGTQSKSAAAG